jgi:hypothetical protein
MTGAAVIIASVWDIQEFKKAVDEDFGTLNRLHLFMTGVGLVGGYGDGSGDRVKGAEEFVVFVDIDVL